MTLKVYMDRHTFKNFKIKKGKEKKAKK
jgi:hypothetical protein